MDCFEPPACDEQACFQTSDLPLLGPPLGGLESFGQGGYWSAAPVLEDGGFEADMAGWQAIADGSLSSSSPFGGAGGAGWM